MPLFVIRTHWLIHKGQGSKPPVYVHGLGSGISNGRVSGTVNTQIVIFNDGPFQKSDGLWFLENHTVHEL
jgi:hypothetical protein